VTALFLLALAVRAKM